mmetsp:Transcript_26630/g.4728  ORF Transcript_26630/g.4728 Transcript_26630/m.4728 type:complete len:80 (+) Transcript_26630:94-333(+)
MTYLIVIVLLQTLSVKFLQRKIVMMEHSEMDQIVNLAKDRAKLVILPRLNVLLVDQDLKESHQMMMIPLIVYVLIRQEV